LNLNAKTPVFGILQNLPTMSRNRVVNAEIAPYAYIGLIEMCRVGQDAQPVTFVNRFTGFFIAPNVVNP